MSVIMKIVPVLRYLAGLFTCVLINVCPLLHNSEVSGDKGASFVCFNFKFQLSTIISCIIIKKKNQLLVNINTVFSGL